MQMIRICQFPCYWTRGRLISTNNMKYNVIFFDADGVILKGGHQFTDKLTELHGLKMENMLPFFKGPFLKCASGSADVKEELSHVLDQWGWSGTVDELMEFWLTQGTPFDQENISIARTLSEKGFRCFVTTGQEKYRGEFIKEHVGNGNPFEDVFYSAEVGCSKNDPTFFKTCFERVSHITTNPSEVLVIDDSKHIIKMAQSLEFETFFCEKNEDLKNVFDYV